MEALEKLMLWAFGVLAWMGVSLSSFGTQDQQMGGKGGFDSESSRHMIFVGYASSAAFCLLAYLNIKHKAFLVASLVLAIGGFLWVYMCPHPVSDFLSELLNAGKVEPIDKWIRGPY